MPATQASPIPGAEERRYQQEPLAYVTKKNALKIMGLTLVVMILGFDPPIEHLIQLDYLYRRFSFVMSCGCHESTRQFFCDENEDEEETNMGRKKSKSRINK